MAISVTLESDEAIVLLELLSSEKLESYVGIPERNALWALEGALEKVLVEPFRQDFDDILAQARKSLVERYGE